MLQAEGQGMGRSLRLFRAFRLEQSDPAMFYTTLADDSVTQARRWVDLDGSRMLDVGGGPGYFAQAFCGAGATYVPVELDVGEFTAQIAPLPRAVAASGLHLPFGNGVFDLAFSSNVLEHVPDPGAMLREMVRVTRPGGTVLASYTVWWGPWGGHETAPWHLLGGRRARARYARRHGREPKNKFGESLFALSVRRGRSLAESVPGSTVLAAVPRYLPSWASGVSRVPVLGELATWNLMLVLRVTERPR